jgi:hypothetical protein
MEHEKRQALHPATLAQFTGTERYTQHWLRPDILMTEGTRHAARHGVAWFVDIIASVQHLQTLCREPFQVWTLAQEGGGAAVTADDGKGTYSTPSESKPPTTHTRNSGCMPFMTEGGSW